MLTIDSIHYKEDVKIAADLLRLKTINQHYHYCTHTYSGGTSAIVSEDNGFRCEICGSYYPAFELSKDKIDKELELFDIDMCRIVNKIKFLYTTLRYNNKEDKKDIENTVLMIIYWLNSNREFLKLSYDKILDLLGSPHCPVTDLELALFNNKNKEEMH